MAESVKVSTETERWQRFGRFVRAYRQDQAGLSQTQAAKAAGMTRQQWNRIEQGSSGSKRSSIIKIAESLRADPITFLNQAGFQEADDLGESQGAGQTSDIEVRRLLHFFSQLPRECKQDVLALTEALWRRRRKEWRAEEIERARSAKHSPEVVKPGVEKSPRVRKAS